MEPKHIFLFLGKSSKSTLSNVHEVNHQFDRVDPAHARLFYISLK